jgi:predicted transposase/invertase (TIGR01784 family)
MEFTQRSELRRWNPTLRKKYNEDEAEMREFYAPQIAMDMLDAKNEGIAIGEERGELKKAKETARKLLAKGIDVADIAEVTGLSVKEIKALQK